MPILRSAITLPKVDKCYEYYYIHKYITGTYNINKLYFDIFDVKVGKEKIVVDGSIVFAKKDIIHGKSNGYIYIIREKVTTAQLLVCEKLANVPGQHLILYIGGIQDETLHEDRHLYWLKEFQVDALAKLNIMQIPQKALIDQAFAMQQSYNTSMLNVNKLNSTCAELDKEIKKKGSMNQQDKVDLYFDNLKLEKYEHYITKMANKDTEVIIDCAARIQDLKNKFELKKNNLTQEEIDVINDNHDEESKKLKEKCEKTKRQIEVEEANITKIDKDIASYSEQTSKRIKFAGEKGEKEAEKVVVDTDFARIYDDERFNRPPKEESEESEEEESDSDEESDEEEDDSEEEDESEEDSEESDGEDSEEE
jgi:hypothetical protein